MSDSVDYDKYIYIRDNAEKVDQCLRKRIKFSSSVYDKILGLIYSIKEKCVVVISDSKLGEYWNLLENYHFSYLKNELEEREIPYVSIHEIDRISQYECSVMIVIEFISKNEFLGQNSLHVFNESKTIKPNILLVSLIKEFSEYEAIAFVNRKKKEEAKNKVLIERERLHKLSHTWKSNKEVFKKYLSENEIFHFYHFTDIRNLQSIKDNGGLYSWKYCEEHNINISYPGGDSISRLLDTRYDLSDYVRLSFCNDHPMKWVLEQKGYDMILLKVSVEVAYLEETLFSDINATDSCHKHGGTFEDLQMVDIAATKLNYVSKENPLFKKHQAEVMVKTFIPLEYIEIPDISPMYAELPF